MVNQTPDEGCLSRATIGSRGTSPTSRKLRRSAKMELYRGGDTVSTEAVAARRHAGSHLPVTWWKTRNANNNLALAA